MKIRPNINRMNETATIKLCRILNIQIIQNQDFSTTNPTIPSHWTSPNAKIPQSALKNGSYVIQFQTAEKRVIASNDKDLTVIIRLNMMT